MSKVIPPTTNNGIQLINKLVRIPVFGLFKNRIDGILEALHILLGGFSQKTKSRHVAQSRVKPKIEAQEVKSITEGCHNRFNRMQPEPTFDQEGVDCGYDIIL